MSLDAPLHQYSTQNLGLSLIVLVFTGRCLEKLHPQRKASEAHSYEREGGVGDG